MNALEHACKVGRFEAGWDEVHPDWPVGLPPLKRVAQPRPRTIKEIEREMILNAVETNTGKMDDVARRLGISRGTLYNRLASYGYGNPFNVVKLSVN